ncbi:Uncharacterised protein [Serratia fonticola]|nr:Uncharacterised protein [Serratia fonticola]
MKMQTEYDYKKYLEVAGIEQPYRATIDDL